MDLIFLVQKSFLFTFFNVGEAKKQFFTAAVTPSLRDATFL
jgi:hypothetical protein